MKDGREPDLTPEQPNDQVSDAEAATDARADDVDTDAGTAIEATVEPVDADLAVDVDVDVVAAAAAEAAVNAESDVAATDAESDVAATDAESDAAEPAVETPGAESTPEGEPEPWWTTHVQSPLVLNTEELTLPTLPTQAPARPEPVRAATPEPVATPPEPVSEPVVPESSAPTQVVPAAEAAVAPAWERGSEPSFDDLTRGAAPADPAALPTPAAEEPTVPVVAPAPVVRTPPVVIAPPAAAPLPTPVPTPTPTPAPAQTPTPPPAAPVGIDIFASAATTPDAATQVMPTAPGVAASVSKSATGVSTGSTNGAGAATGVSTGSTNGAGATTGTGPNGGSVSKSGGSTSTLQKALISAAAVLLVIIVLVGLFFVGQKLGGGSTPVAIASPSATAKPSAKPSATPTPTPTVEPTGPQTVGVHKWNTLRGGECLQPYTSPWDEDFTVVDCATPHAAQLVYRGVVNPDPAAVFPGEATLAAQMNLLCNAPGVIDLNAAGAYPDVQVQGSYPATADEWKAGDRFYYCFVSRSSGDPLTASLAGPGPTT